MPEPNYARLFAEAKADALLDAVQAGHISIRPGWWMARVSLRFPEVPAAIWWRSHEPGNPDNVMDRGHWAAMLAGYECDPLSVLACKMRREITEAEYRFRTAERAWAKEFAPSDPAALHAHREADLTQMEPIGPWT